MNVFFYICETPSNQVLFNDLNLLCKLTSILQRYWLSTDSNLFQSKVEKNTETNQIMVLFFMTILVYWDHSHNIRRTTRCIQFVAGRHARKNR
jgi:hypothetical protein